MSKIKVNSSPEREYDRGFFRSELVSLFWAVISERKRSAPRDFTLSEIARTLGVDKSQVSRWFNGLPNWEANTMADIASALDVDLRVIARDRRTGVFYSSSGTHENVVTKTAPLIGDKKFVADDQATCQLSGAGWIISGKFRMLDTAA